MTKTNTNATNQYAIEFMSESGDEYTIIISANKEPTTDEHLLEIIKKELTHEYDISLSEPGPGICGTYLHNTNVIRINNTVIRFYQFD